MARAEVGGRYLNWIFLSLVIPAKAGIFFGIVHDSGFRRNDEV